MPPLLLTPFDHRLLALLSTGCSGSDAARRLGLSLADVAQRLAEIRVLLGVDSTAAAVRAVRRNRST